MLFDDISVFFILAAITIIGGVVFNTLKSLWATVPLMVFVGAVWYTVLHPLAQ